MFLIMCHLPFCPGGGGFPHVTISHNAISQSHVMVRALAHIYPCHKGTTQVIPDTLKRVHLDLTTWEPFPLPGHVQTCSLAQTVGKWAVGIRLKCLLVAACKTKLREGNVFTPVCHSAHGGRGSPLWTETPVDRVPPSLPVATEADGTHATGKCT